MNSCFMHPLGRQCEPLDCDIGTRSSYHPSVLQLWLGKTISVFVYQIKVRITSVYGIISLYFAGGGLFSAPIQSPSDLFSFSHIRNAMRMNDDRLGALRTASTKGVRATVAEQVGDEMERSHEGKDPEREAGIAPHQQIGLGLPMSNIFATWVSFHPSGKT